jgi:hypothetical protein
MSRMILLTGDMVISFDTEKFRSHSVSILYVKQLLSQHMSQTRTHGLNIIRGEEHEVRHL